MAAFKQINGGFYRQDDSGQLYAVADKETLTALKSGQLAYSVEPNTRALTFADPNNPNYNSKSADLFRTLSIGSASGTNPAAPTKLPSSGATTSSADFSSILKSKLTAALTNYKGVTDVSQLEARRQELLRKQLLSSPYSSASEEVLTGAQKLSLMRSQGSEYEPLIKSLEEQITSAKSGDQTSIDAIAKLASVANALGIDVGTGGEMQSTMGKEYSDYSKDQKARGLPVMSLNEYANMDANRKRAVTIVGGMTPSQTTTFNSIVDKYNKSPLVMANDRTIVLKTISEQLKKDPKNAALQVSFIYSLIQALDTYQSSVREGEIGLIGGTQGLADTIRNLPDKIAQGTILNEVVLNRYLSSADTLVQSIQSAADIKKKQFGSQASTAGVGDAWSTYQSGLGSTPDSPAASTPKTMRVKRIKDGATGTILESEYDPKLYKKI